MPVGGTGRPLTRPVRPKGTQLSKSQTSTYSYWGARDLVKDVLASAASSGLRAVNVLGVLADAYGFTDQDEVSEGN